MQSSAIALPLDFVALRSRAQGLVTLYPFQYRSEVERSGSPPPFRVKAPMAHFPAFATAFGCKPGDAMVAEPRLTVW